MRTMMRAISAVHSSSSSVGCSTKERWWACPKASCWNGLPRAMTNPPSRLCSLGTGRWSWESVDSCSGDPNDVDDAFQATFLVLVRKAGSLRRCDLLGNWLYGVAYRVATRARVLAARRIAKAPFGQATVDGLDASGNGPATNGDSTCGLDPNPRPWLHEEVARLPEKYRVPVRLCYFEGLTHDEAAQRLGWPLGTVKGRLSRARDLLRRRLTRRGVTFSAGALASQLALADARAAVPDSLEYATLQAALAVVDAANAPIATVSKVSLSVASLTEGVLQTMIMTHAKFVVTLLVVCGDRRHGHRCDTDHAGRGGQ